MYVIGIGKKRAVRRRRGLMFFEWSAQHSMDGLDRNRFGLSVTNKPRRMRVYHTVIWPVTAIREIIIYVRAFGLLYVIISYC